MNALLNAGVDASDALVSFIDLLQVKVNDLNDLLETLQNTLDAINDIMSLPGFHLLYVSPAAGGVSRFINELQTASGGPTTDENGYVIGIVLLAGGPNASRIMDGLSIIF